MSRHAMKPFVVLAALILVPAGTVRAQCFNPFNTCGTCAPRPHFLCPFRCLTCPPPACPCPTVAPPQVSYQDVVETRYRNEQVVQQVPVTRLRNVTVDEGHYQTVWVPRPVTKQVAETVLEQRVGTRTVPYQVIRRVPQSSTCGSTAVSIAPAQPVQLQSPAGVRSGPIRSSRGAYLVPPVQPYEPNNTSAATSGLVPHPRHLDPPSAHTLRDLSSAPAPYDSQVTTTHGSPVKTRAAASVFRHYR